MKFSGSFVLASAIAVFAPAVAGAAINGEGLALTTSILPHDDGLILPTGSRPEPAINTAIPDPEASTNATTFSTSLATDVIGNPFSLAWCDPRAWRLEWPNIEWGTERLFAKCIGKFGDDSQREDPIWSVIDLDHCIGNLDGNMIRSRE